MKYLHTMIRVRDIDATLRFFWRLPQGAAPNGTAGDHGFFYHFLTYDTGLRFKDVELSSIDKPGFWEVRGYHNYGDPWLEQRYDEE